MQPLLFFLCALILSWSSQGFSAEQQFELDAIEVIAESKADPVQSGDIRVFTQADFALRYQSLGDFLNTVNGIQIQHSGALGDPVLASIQGGDARQTIVTINGVQLNSSQYGNYNLNQIALNQIEKIEIHNNSLATNVPGAATATINIITKDTENTTNFGASAGSYGYRKSDISVASRSGFTLQYSDLRSQNDFKYPVTSPAFSPSDKGREEKLKNSQYRKQQFRITYTQSNISASLFSNIEDKNIPDYFRNNPINDAELKTSQYNAIVSVFFSSHNIDNEWQAFYQQQKDRYLDRAGAIGLGEDDDRYDTVKSQLQWNLNYQEKYWKLAATTQWYEETYNSRYLNDDDSHVCQTPQGNCDQAAFQTSWRNAAAIAFHDTQQRHEVSVKSELFNLSNSNRLRNSHDNQTTENNMIQGYLWRYRWQPHWGTLNVSYKKAPRIPSLFELFGDRGLLLSNSSLQPEIAQTTSLDLLVKPYDSTALSLTVFSRQLNDAIVAIYDSRGVGRYENTSKATITGYDLQLRKEYGIFYGQIDYNRYHSNTKSDDVLSLDDKYLAGIYHKTSQFIAGLTTSEHNLSLLHQRNSELYVDRSNLVKGDNSHIWSLAYQFIRSTYQAGVSITNLTDSKHLDFTNRPAQRRQVITYINLKF